MTLTAIEVVGCLGSFIFAGSVFCQLEKVLRTKSAQDLSLTFQLLYLLGLICLCTYGFGKNLWPIYIPVSVEVVGAVFLVGSKVYYDEKNKDTFTRM